MPLNPRALIHDVPTAVPGQDAPECKDVPDAASLVVTVRFSSGSRSVVRFIRLVYIDYRGKLVGGTLPDCTAKER